MKFSSGEKKMLAFCVVAIALPLGVGLFLNRINATPIVNIPAPPKPPKPNGYDLYVAAATAMAQFKPPVDQVNDTELIKDPKVRAQRYSLARRAAWLNANQKAFALFNQAMKTPTLSPTARSFKTSFPSYAQLRELARDKLAQSNTLWMRGDYNGALQSSLDTIQMGHDMRRGGVLITELVGVAIGAIGRRGAGGIIEHLDEKQAKVGAQRLKKLLEKRCDLPQVLTEEKWFNQAGMLETFGRKDWRSNYYGSNGSFRQKWQSYTISKQQIIDDIGANYDRQIVNAKLPFARKGVPPATLNDPFAEIAQSDDKLERINDARDLVGDQMLMMRLALHAYQLENGAYPPKLNVLVPNYVNAIPADPFGGGEALRYKISGKTYVLWSIGPDGKDDGGTPIPPHNKRNTPFPGERPFGVQQFVDFDGKGDVVAGINE